MTGPPGAFRCNVLFSASCALSMHSMRTVFCGRCPRCRSDRASVWPSSSFDGLTPAAGISRGSPLMPTTISPWRKLDLTNGLPPLVARTGGEARRDLVGRSWALPYAGANGRRPVIVWQSDTLTRLLRSVLVVPLTTNLDRAKLAGTALISASDDGLAADSVALAFQMRAIPKACLKTRIRTLSVEELAELDLATDEAVGRVEPETEPE